MLTLGQAIDSISNSRWYCFTSALLGLGLGENELEGGAAAVVTA